MSEIPNGVKLVLKTTDADTLLLIIQEAARELESRTPYAVRFLGESFDTTCTGSITAGLPEGQEVCLSCPVCGETANLTVFGKLGEAGRVRCPCGHQFDPPPPFEPIRLLIDTATNSNRARML